MEELRLDSRRQQQRRQPPRVSCGASHAFLLFEDGSLAAYGHNDHGQLGLGNTVDRKRFVRVPLSQRVAQVACGDWHTLIRFESGTVAACGSNSFWQLGLGDRSEHSYPHFTEVPCPPAVDVACGRFHSVLRFADGKVASCGYNGNGQLGLGDCSTRATFEVVKTHSSPVVEISCGAHHTFLRHEPRDGQLTLTGNGCYSQLSSVTTFSPIIQVACACDGIYTVFRYEDGTLEGYGDRVGTS